jgi:pimeloyl-ACP methyl ester carboxylesterase
MGLALMCSLKSMASDACYESVADHSIVGLVKAQTYYPPGADCKEYMIPVEITSDNFVFNGTEWDDDYGLQDFISLATTRPSAMFPTVLSGPKTETATYKIAASFCTPKHKNGKEKTVILATHGIGPARAHWNSPFRPKEFNFVQYAIGQGYSVFFYDRLGTGASEKYIPPFHSGYSR